MPLVSIAKANPACLEPLNKLSQFLTPQQFHKTTRKAFSASAYDDVLRSIAQLQYEYIGWPRKNSVRVRGPWFGILAPCQAHLLGAANIEARIRFAKNAVHQLRLHLESYEGPVCFFSVCPRQYVLPLHTAHLTDLHGLKRLTGQIFAGCSFVGSMDFALFKGFGKGGVSPLA